MPALRGDIQGLRAIAVLLVVAFHAQLGPAGGLLGVDLFFTISGFVITQKLLGELDIDGTINLREFYARRARRLLPALALMLVVALVLTVLLLNPSGPQLPAIRTAAATTVFSSNAYLYLHTGYFDSTSALNPFLHTWSLAVEEQFYLALPILVLLAGRRSRKERTGGSALSRHTLLRWMITIGVVSLMLATVLDQGWVTFGLGAPQRFAFYSSPTRAWEFLAGCLLAVAWPRVVRVGVGPATAVGAVGVALVAVSVLTVDPGATAGVVVQLGIVAAAVALLTAGDRSPLFHHMLSWQPLVALGDCSYAWYLWHWPAIVFASVIWHGDRLAIGLAAVAAYLPAWLSTRFVERPLRARRPTIDHHPLRFAMGCVVVPLLVTGAAWSGATAGWGLREPDGWYDLADGRNVGCNLFNRDIANQWPEQSCRTSVPAALGTVLILGDQQADSASTGIIEAAHSLQLDTALWSRTRCPFLSRTPVHYPRCAEWNRAALDLIDRLRPSAVVIVNDAVAYTTEARADEVIANRDGSRPSGDEEALAIWRDGLDGLLNQLDDRGVPAVVIGGVPGYGPRFPRDSFSVLRPDPAANTLSLAEAQQRRARVFEVETAVVTAHKRAEFVDPLPAICDPTCTTRRGKTWLYYESEYLTRAGSRLLTPDVRAALITVLGR